MKAIIKKILIFFMWYPLRIIINILPLRVTYLIGIVGGFLLYLVSKEKHKIMAEELILVFPNRSISEIKEIIMGSFVNYCLSEMEVLLYPSLNNRFINKNFIIEGREYLDEALSKGKGVILFQAHFGAFQMTMPAIGYSGYKMNQISASAALWKDNVNISDLQKKTYDIKARYENALPVNHISIKSSLRPVFSALKRNEIVGITVDGGGGKKIVLIRFLGRNANFQKGAANLAIRTEAEIVPAFIITENSLKHRLILHQPIKFMRTKERDENIKEVLNKFARILESYVYKYPSHYGYTVYFRRSRASLDPYPFFQDYEVPQDKNLNNKMRRGDYA
jgi:phosphatidylinositol dimannoside acyltransferase